MASPAKISSSSSSIPCRTNSNMKKSELCDPIRRSFNGNPFTKPAVLTNPRAFNPYTPVNTPSDFPRRLSTGRESVASLRDPDKENSKDQNPKPTRLRSPAVSKGTKNFMAPTISAASKINASPRKKILVERNEPARSSVSFSDVKSLTMEDDESTPEIALKQKKVSFSDVESIIIEDNVSTPEIGLNQKVSFFDVKSVIMDDNESTRQTFLKQNNVEVPHELQSNIHEYKEPLKSNDDSLMEALPEEKGSVKVESTPEIALKQKKVSFSDVKSIIMEDNESTPEIGLNQTVSFFDVKSIIMEDNESTEQIVLKQNNVEVPHELQSNNHEYKQPSESNADSVEVIPNFEISPKVSISPSCPTLAPHDADPLMLPYDPKTNYLSPRPQFLHYRPNPRIELYRERDDKQLEECFATESYSDTDVTEETQSEGSQRESEDISSEETNPIAAAMVEESFEAKRMSKQRFSPRSKFIALLMVLVFAYFSVLAANSPAFTSSGLEELSLLNFHVPPEVARFAKAKFELFTENLQHWSASFLSNVSNIVSSSREGDKFCLFEYANLSHLLEDHMIEGERDAGTELFDNQYYRELEADEAVDEDEELDDQKNEDFKNQELVSEEETDAGEDEEQEQKNEDFKTLELVSDKETVAVEQETGAEKIELDQLEAGSNEDLKDQPTIIPQATEIQHDISKTPEGDELNYIAETMFPEEDSTYSSQSSVDDSTINGLEDQFLTKNTTGFALFVLCLLSASALIYTKRRKPSMTNASVPVKQPVSAGSKDTIHERQTSRNWQTEMDMASETCPSDISNCHRNSSSYNRKGLKEPNEYQSQERKTRKTSRRESFASTDYSMGSSSYGSFTTYDKIPGKHGGGDEGIVTPVRRSSRIRNQVTSP